MTTRYVRDWNTGFNSGLCVGLVLGGIIFAAGFALLITLLGK